MSASLSPLPTAACARPVPVAAECRARRRSPRSSCPGDDGPCRVPGRPGRVRRRRAAGPHRGQDLPHRGEARALRGLDAARGRPVRARLRPHERGRPPGRPHGRAQRGRVHRAPRPPLRRSGRARRHGDRDRRPDRRGRGAGHALRARAHRSDELPPARPPDGPVAAGRGGRARTSHASASRRTRSSRAASIVGARGGSAYGVDYTIVCGPDWAVRALDLGTSDGMALSLRSDGLGRWTHHDGKPLPEFDGCLDVDLAGSPFTNTLPIRRLWPDLGQRRGASGHALRPVRPRSCPCRDGQVYTGAGGRRAAFATRPTDRVLRGRPARRRRRARPRLPDPVRPA